jgi:hypothetical protein
MKKILVLMGFLSSFVFALDSYQVAFETTECSGEHGFATVEIADIDKIQSAGCRYEGKKLQKLLIRKNGTYETYTLTYDEAKAVMQDVKLYNRARLKMMENANTLVITK